jgi:hypothetical protein
LDSTIIFYKGGWKIPNDDRKIVKKMGENIFEGHGANELGDKSVGIVGGFGLGSLTSTCPTM